MLFECILILTFIESLVLTLSYFFRLFSTGLWIVQVWPINYTFCFRHGQIQEHCFYWIVFSTGIFKKVNLVLLTYHQIVGVGFVNYTAYLWHLPKLTYLSHVPKLRQYLWLNWGLLVLPFMVAFSFLSLNCKLWILFWTFWDMWIVLK